MNLVDGPCVPRAIDVPRDLAGAAIGNARLVVVLPIPSLFADEHHPKVRARREARVRGLVGLSREGNADEAVNLDPNDPANYANRAAVMHALKRDDDAIADLRKGLSLNPGESRKRQLEDALRDLGASP